MREVGQEPGTAIDRVRIFFRKHGVRISGAAVVMVAAAILIGAPSSHLAVWLVFLVPLMVGACIPLASRDAVSAAINGWGGYFDRGLNRAQGREGKFSRYFSRPLHWGSLKLWSVSERIQNGHIRAGVRLGAIVYFWAAILLALAMLVIMAVYVIVLVVVLIVGFAIVGGSLSQGQHSGGRSYSPKRSVMSFFSRECGNCGSKEHATSDCPHGFFSSKCGRCGSKSHATGDCPHGFLSSKCGRCGSTHHATSDCPHGIFSSECGKCGSKNHATSDCPHGFFSSKCGNCGGKDHGTSECPH